MSTTTIASAAAINDNEIAILVEAAEATSLYGFLKKKNIECSPPKDAVFRPRRVTRDSSGRIRVEEEALESEIIAQGTLQDFESWMHEWLFPNQMAQV